MKNSNKRNWNGICDLPCHTGTYIFEFFHVFKALNHSRSVWIGKKMCWGCVYDAVSYCSISSILQLKQILVQCVRNVLKWPKYLIVSTRFMSTPKHKIFMHMSYYWEYDNVINWQNVNPLSGIAVLYENQNVNTSYDSRQRKIQFIKSSLNQKG